MIRSGNKNSLVVIISAELRRGHGATCHPHTGRSALTRRLRLFYMAAIARRTFDIVTIWTILFHMQTCKHGIKLRAFKKMIISNSTRHHSMLSQKPDLAPQLCLAEIVYIIPMFCAGFGRGRPHKNHCYGNHGLGKI